ncbi:T9SS type A sorting domain-containing protein [Aureivirga sp. CE67]|uniref:T9SS type A sorting domain-containing protein n=1 Tax=Aureivirga sp. CE67 TaxID=1788983 RepID=UPI0018C9AE1B|nr:T9SS type A sorting domain-containing protein [Aureivirga sp. CE67]
MTLKTTFYTIYFTVLFLFFLSNPMYSNDKNKGIFRTLKNEFHSTKTANSFTLKEDLLNKKSSKVYFTDCPPEDITLSSQDDIDNFIINYPNCTNFDGAILIQNDNSGSIHNLNGLKNLISVEDLVIEFIPNLSSLEGLENLEFITEDLVISFNSNLNICNNICPALVFHTYETSYIGFNGPNCSDINNIKSNCQNNCPVTDIVFNTQSQIDDFILNHPNCEYLNKSITITENIPGNITNLNGLKKIKTIENLTISNNSNLENLNGLESLTLVNGTISITNNSNLDLCKTLCKPLNDQTYSGLSISGNKTGCDSKSEITSNCDPECPPGSMNFTTQSELDNFKTMYPHCTEINGDLSIIENSDGEISDLTPLANLNTISGSLRINSNSSLNCLEALGNILEIGNDFEIYNNTSLNSLYGLNLDSVGGNLSIHENENLDDCYHLCEIMNTNNAISGSILIQNNLANCETETLMLSNCNESYIELPAIIVDCSYSPTYDNFPELDLICNSIDAKILNDFNFSGYGTYTLNWEFVDENGEIFLANQEVTIQDNESPTFMNCIPSQTILLEEGEEYEIPDYTVFNFDLNDNCAESINIQQTPESGTFITETTQINIKFTDENNNSSYCVFNLNIEEKLDISKYDDIGLKLYPNPTTNNLEIETKSPIKSISIIDIKGKIVLHKKDFKSKTLDLNNLNNGQYIVKIEFENNTISKNIIISK